MKKFGPHLFVLCALAVAWLIGASDSLRTTLEDLRPGWAPRQATKSVVVVAIDSVSLQKIGYWPWPRSLHASMVDQLVAAGASDIAFDIDLSSRSDRDSDNALRDALKRAGGAVVLPAFKQEIRDPAGRRKYFINRPLPIFDENAWTALVNVSAERDGVVRRYPYGDRLGQSDVPSMAALLAGGKRDSDRSFWIDFGIQPASIPVVSYADVLGGDPAALALVKGKKVVVGGTAIELGDRFVIPKGRVLPGPIVQALAAESILQNRDLHRLSPIVGLPFVGALMLAMLLVWQRLPASVRVMILLGIAVAAEAGATLVQAKMPLIIDTSILQIGVAAYLLAIALDEVGVRGLLNKIAESRFQRIAMSLGDGVLCTDQDGRITLWNSGASAIFGYEPKEMIGKPIQVVLPKHGEVCFSLAQLPQADIKAPGGKVMEIEGLRKNGDVFPLEACFSGWEGIDGLQYGIVLRDITERKKEADRIRFLAEFDTLTGLANRHSLARHLDRAIAQSDVGFGQVALILLDLDTFKQINDTLGHTCGDQILTAVGRELKQLAGGIGLAARLGGDEFAVAVAGDGAADLARNLCTALLTRFSDFPISAQGRELLVKASIGAAIYPDDASTRDELLGSADLALYRAKALGRGRLVFFEQPLRAELEARLALERELKTAVASSEFELFYQPQVNLKDRTVIGAEALIRWHHPTRGLVPPAEFMPIINASALSGDLGLWVLRTACTQARQWLSQGYALRVAVNLSPAQIHSGELSTTVASILAETGLPPSLLELEVTEDSVIIDEERSLQNFREIQALGVRLAFDDFGTGYASLSYLKKFPLDVLKIDRTFVMELRPSTEDAAIVQSTVALSKQLGLSVIAEGIEDAGTAEYLCLMGCDEGQGYFFGRPMPALEFQEKFLAVQALAGTGPSVAA